MNYHEDIRDSVLKHFGFLQKNGFSSFELEQLAYEFHLRTRKDDICVNIQYEQILYTNIWITVNGLPLAYNEPQNEKLKKILKEKEDLYDNQNRKKVLPNDINEKYISRGKDLNDSIIKESADILKRNMNVLDGDLQKMQEWSALIQKKREQKEYEFNKANKIYRCDFDWRNKGGIFYFEGTLQEIKKHLEEMNEEVSNVKIFDWDENEIKLGPDN